MSSVHVTPAQQSLFAVPKCPCNMGPFIHDEGIELWCACGIREFRDVADYLDWLAAGPATKEPEQREAA